MGVRVCERFQLLPDNMMRQNRTATQLPMNLMNPNSPPCKEEKCLGESLRGFEKTFTVRVLANAHEKLLASCCHPVKAGSCTDESA